MASSNFKRFEHDFRKLKADLTAKGFGPILQNLPNKPDAIKENTAIKDWVHDDVIILDVAFVVGKYTGEVVRVTSDKVYLQKFNKIPPGTDVPKSGMIRYQGTFEGDWMPIAPFCWSPVLATGLSEGGSSETWALIRYYLCEFVIKTRAAIGSVQCPLLADLESALVLVGDTDQFRGLNVSAYDAPTDRATAKLENSDEVGLNHGPFAIGRPKLLEQPGNGGRIALREISGNILAKPRPQQESDKNNFKGEGDKEPRIWPGFDTLDEIRRSVPSVYRNKLPGLDAMVFEPHTKSFRERFLPLRLCIGVHNDKTSEVHKAGGKVWVYLRYNIDVNRSPSPQLELDFTSVGRHGQCQIDRQDILDGRIDLEPAFANTQRSWLYIFALIRWYFLLASESRLHNFLMHRIPFNVTFKRNLIQACKTYGPRQPTFDTEIKAPEYSDEDSEHEINIGAPHRKRGYKKEPGLAKVYKRDPEEAELSEEERVQRRRANNAKGRVRQTLVSQQATMNAEVAAEFGESELPGRRGARSMVRQVKQEPKDNPSANVHSPVKEMATYFDTLPPDIPDYAIKRQPCDDS